jgi:hypothetical protein
VRVTEEYDADAMGSDGPAGKLRDTAGRVADRAAALASDHPLATTAAAVAAGAMIGIMLPRWKVGASVGTAVGSRVIPTARRIASMVAMAESAKSIIGTLTAAGQNVRDNAQRIVEKTPAPAAVKAAAGRAAAQVGAAAGRARAVARKSVGASPAGGESPEGEKDESNGQAG